MFVWKVYWTGIYMGNVTAKTEEKAIKLAASFFGGQIHKYSAVKVYDLTQKCEIT